MRPRVIIACFLLLLAASVSAQSQIGLYNTGTWLRQGNRWVNPYTLISSPYGATGGVKLYEPADTVWPINGVWLDNVTTGRPSDQVQWLAVGFADTTPSTSRIPTMDDGDYTIRLEFDAGTYDPATLGFTINAAADNRLAVKLNGLILPNYGTATGDVNYSNLASYSYAVAGTASGLHAGTNYIDFVVTNASGAGENPAGLYVTFSDFTTAVPEPSTYALLLGVSTGTLVLWRRRQRRPGF